VGGRSYDYNVRYDMGMLYVSCVNLCHVLAGLFHVTAFSAALLLFCFVTRWCPLDLVLIY
jgi:hypothetical protein